MFIEVFKNSLMISIFVFVMMLLVEYLNVYSQGGWQKKLLYNKWLQYVVCSLLGAIPGCLGSFAVVTMYSHRVVSIGALMATMIATSGDGAFVMLAMFPKQALILTLILFLTGILVGAVIDLFFSKNSCNNFCADKIQVHKQNDSLCCLLSFKESFMHLKKSSLARGLLLLSLIASFILLITGAIGHEHSWGWEKITALVLIISSSFIVFSSTDHFLEKHLWEHVVKKHLFKIFAWTFVALLIVHLIADHLFLDNIVKTNPWSLLALSSLIGIIPDSGPHLIFTSMFAKGLIPFSILFCNSLIQDGHGMLPVLGFSRKTFIFIKLIKILVGLSIASILMLFGI